MQRLTRGERSKGSPNLYIIAGPNGAGKTTFAREFLPHYAKCKNFVNADLIAQGLSPFSPAAAGIKAGRLLLKQIHEFAERRADFAFETTLSGKTYVTLLRRLKQHGYVIHLFFLWAPSVELVIARIKDRVAEGGHDVPVTDVRRRFGRSMKNFFKVYKPLLDSWTLFDNSTTWPSLIAEEKGGKLIVVDPELFAKICKTVE
ncbi:MAG: zeta toxin family protein [Candidatus Omnitrophota bacterium]|nr:zeta toxin family protein [Candidatus Omnitrophota bacterium]